MSQNDLLMALASTLVGVAVGGYLVVRLARRFLPASGREGFPSRGQVWTHFRAAGALLLHKRWLLYLPLGLVLVSCLYSGAQRWWLEAERARWSGPRGYRDLSEPLPIALYIRAVLGTFRMPLDGYPGALRKSLPTIILFPIAFLLAFGRLKQRTTQENRRRLALVARMAWLYLACLILVGVALPFLDGGRDLFHGKGAFWFALLLVYAILIPLVMTVAGLFLSAVVEGGFLLYFRALIRGEDCRFADAWNGALSVLGPLVKLNVLGFLVLELPFSLPSFATVLISSDGERGYAIHRFILELCSWWRHPAKVVALLFCCTPFFVVVNREKVVTALRANLAFVRDHLVKWALIVGSCVLLLAASNVVGLVVSHRFQHVGWYGSILVSPSDALSVCVVALCALALFRFFLQYGAREEPAVSGGESTTESQGGMERDQGGPASPKGHKQ